MKISNVGLAATLTIVLYGVALVYLYSTTRTDPGSAFYDRVHGRDYKYTKYRRREVAEFLAQQSHHGGAPKTSTSLSSTPANASLCVAIMSAKRSGKQYIDEAVGSILVNLTAVERSKLWIILYMASTNVGQPPIVANLVDDTLNYDTLSVETRLQLEAWEEEGNLPAQIQKANYDYAAALDACIATTLPWVMILEDDIIMAHGWLERLEHALLHLAKDATDRWAYVRLFYADRFQNWRADDVDHYVVWSLGTILVVTIILYLCFNGLHMVYSFKINAPIVLLSLLVSTCLISLVFLGGRSSMIPRPSLVKMNDGGCCSQGLVYPRDSAIALSHFLKTGPRDLFADSMIEAWADRNALDRWAISPPVLQHVGARTTKMRDDEALSESPDVATGSARLWNFQFEQYVPA